jgi:hypothetical protein
MLRHLLPKEVVFFDFFEQHAAIGVEVCRQLLAMATEGNNIEAGQLRIKELEHQADDIARTCIESLHKTFITPFDRGEIHGLMSKLDDVIDSIDSAASRMVLYQIRQMRPEVQKSAEVLLSSALDIEQALKLMRNFKNAPQIEQFCAHIHHLENEGDKILREALVRLFNEEPNAVMVIKWKEIYERLEKATDRCEAVANIIQGIVIEAT